MPKIKVKDTKKVKKPLKSINKAKSKKKEEPNMNNMLELDVDIDFEKLVTTEYMKLQREYRLMEDRRHHLAGAGKALSKQAHLVEMIRNEVEHLETNLYNADSEQWHTVDRKCVETVLAILEFYEKAIADTNYCVKNIREMVSHVDKITKQLIGHQLRVQGIYGNSMTVPQAERRQKILENRLYLYTTRYDLKLSSNKELREEINMMLKLRGLFYQRHMGMKRLMIKIRLRMTEVVFTATQAYEQRDELVANIHNLRDKNDKDTRQHILEIKEFHRLLHHDAKTREFNMLKNKEREMLESAHQRDARRNLAKLEEIDLGLIFYAQSFKKILKISTYDTLESLIKHYKEIEQQNFARFVAISDVNHEVTVLKEETTTMSTEIEELFIAAKNLDESRRSQMEDSEYILEKKGDELQQMKFILATTEHQMKDTLEVMNTIFKDANCSDQAIMRLLGSKEPVVVIPRNAIICMRSIETRIRELVYDKGMLDLQKTIELDNVPLARATGGKQVTPAKGKHAGGPFVPNVIVTGRVDGEDEEDEEDRGSRVISAKDFRIKVQDKMQLKRALDDRASKVLGSSASGIINRERGSLISVVSN